MYDLTTETGSTVTASSLRGPGDKTPVGVNETAVNAGGRGPSKANPALADEIKKFLMQYFLADTDM